jgi:hypothetical protein
MADCNSGPGLRPPFPPEIWNVTGFTPKWGFAIVLPSAAHFTGGETEPEPGSWSLVVLALGPF